MAGALRDHHSNTRPARRARAEMFAIYGDTCHICGHPGANTADHLIPISIWPDQPIDPHGMRPAHGRLGCPTCGRKCNLERGNRPLTQPLRTSEAW